MQDQEEEEGFSQLTSGLNSVITIHRYKCIITKVQIQPFCIVFRSVFTLMVMFGIILSVF